MLYMTTYKVACSPRRQADNKWEIQLTDLNSRGDFKIKVIFQTLDQNIATGLVIEGPNTYCGKILTVEILAGWSSKKRMEGIIDVSMSNNPIYKSLSELEKDDKMRDIVAPA